MNIRTRLSSCATALAVSLSFVAVVPAHAQQAVAQSGLVGSVPVSYTPNIDGGIVLALAQSGSWVVAGGTFTSATQHGTTTAVPNNGLVAFDQTTGALDTGFAPTLDGEVDSLLPGPTPNTVYVGGKFGTVNGSRAKGLALLNLSDGSLVAGFSSPFLDAPVYSMRMTGGRLLITGAFHTAGGATHNGLAAINPTTGAVLPYLTVQLTGHHNYNGTGSNGAVGGRAMDVSADGTRAMVVGDFKMADGVVHDQIVMLDLGPTSAVVDPNWNTGRFGAACARNAFDSYVEDVSFAPDGSYFAVATTGGGGISNNPDGTRSLCDSASRWATTDTGTNVQPTWVDWTGNDSFWCIAVTGAAIYVGGHERFMNNPNGSDNAAPGAVARPGIAALDPISGLPLKWNPGRNPRGAGAYALLATSLGLYVGSDTNYFGNYTYKRDEIGFFPLNKGYTAAPTTTTSLPSNVYETGPLATAPSSNVLYRVNAAGPAVTSIDSGPNWLADQSSSDPGAAYRNQGSSAASYSQIANVASNVPASTPSAIFNSERYSPNDNPPMTWNFPATAGSQVEVRLYFANRYSGTSHPGQRVFDVSLDGTKVLTNYDIVASAGDQTGTMQAFDITVPTSGTYTGAINLQFTHDIENPLINGIEIVALNSNNPPPGGPGEDDLAYRPVATNRIGVQATVPATGIAWGSTRGAFMVGSTIFYGDASANFYSASFNGTTVGTPVAVDPYDDPAWMTVKTDGTKNYAGVKTGYYAQLPSVTGAFYSDGRLYYALSGQTSLRYRYFTPDSGTIGGQEFTATGGNFANIAGMFLSGNTLYYANRSDGSLHSLAFTDGGTNGQNPSVDASTDAVVSGPALDGNDWRSRSMFAFGQASFPDQPPTAVASGSCTVLTCSFDGTLSSDPDGSVASYAWDFGDGTTGTGATPTHGYAAAGTYTYMLTVTDDRGVASTPVLGSVTTTGLTTPIAFNSVTHGYKNGATSVSVTTPGTVAAGDTELLYVSAVNTVANAIVAPAGWTLVASQSPLPLQVAVFQKTAAATDAGSVVTASVTSASQLAVQLVDYSNVAATALVAAAATDAATASHTAPAVGVANGGSWVVSFWADKSSSTTAWTLPATVAQRDQTIGINGGRVTAALADSGVPVPSGTYPAQTATVGATASAKGAMISLVLAPTS